MWRIVHEKTADGEFNVLIVIIFVIFGLFLVVFWMSFWMISGLFGNDAQVKAGLPRRKILKLRIVILQDRSKDIKILKEKSGKRFL